MVKMAWRQIFTLRQATVQDDHKDLQMLNLDELEKSVGPKKNKFWSSLHWSPLNLTPTPPPSTEYTLSN